MQDFKKLEIWHLAHRLTLELFRVCDGRWSRFPTLRSQTLRAVQSIGSNIAEGSGGENADFARFLGHALRSTLEVENDLLLARDLGLIRESDWLPLGERTDNLRRKIIALIRRVNAARRTTHDAQPTTVLPEPVPAETRPTSTKSSTPL